MPKGEGSAMGNEMKTVIETLRNKSNLERFIRMGAEKIYGEEPPQIVEDRIAEELQMIRTFGYEEMLINTYLVVQVIKDAGEYHLAKGMAGASLVNYLLDITSVNPLPPHLREDLSWRQTPVLQSHTIWRQGHDSPFDATETE